MAVSGYSSTPKQCPGGDPPRTMAGRPLAAFLLVAGGSVLLLGCATAGHAGRASSSLVAGVRAGPMSRAQLALATAVADRFASTYARTAYVRDPPLLPDATGAVQAHVRASAAHVPSRRRRLDPHAGSIALEVKTASSVDASVVVRGGDVPPFAVGFTVRMTPAGWRVTSISLPG
jgi:hypothetical protein